MRITTRSARSSKACAHLTNKARCIGSRKCCTPARIFASSRGASSFSRARTSASPIRKRCRSPSQRNKRSNLSDCRKRAFLSRTPPLTCAARRKVAKPTKRSAKRPKKSNLNTPSACRSTLRTNISRSTRKAELWLTSWCSGCIRGFRSGSPPRSVNLGRPQARRFSQTPPTSSRFGENLITGTHQVAGWKIFIQREEGGSCDPPSDLTVRRCFSLALALRNDFVQFENRQEHRDHDSADDDAEEHDQHRLDQGRERIEHGLDFFAPENRLFFGVGV